MEDRKYNRNGKVHAVKQLVTKLIFGKLFCQVFMTSW